MTRKELIDLVHSSGRDPCKPHLYVLCLDAAAEEAIRTWGRADVGQHLLERIQQEGVRATMYKFLGLPVMYDAERVEVKALDALTKDELIKLFLQKIQILDESWSPR